MRIRRALYLVVLKRGIPSPLARESDEEKPAADKSKEPAAKDEKPKGDKAKEDKPAPKTETVIIDFDVIDQRVLALPVPPGEFHNLQAGSAGEVYSPEMRGNVLQKPGPRPRGKP